MESSLTPAVDRSHRKAIQKAKLAQKMCAAVTLTKKMSEANGLSNTWNSMYLPNMTQWVKKEAC
jgi:hypothetical protein